MNNPHPVPEEWLACPVTHEKFAKKNGQLCSSFACYSSDSKFGYWNFIPSNLKELNSPLWKTWEQLQANGVSSYINSPANNLGVGPRRDFLQFAAFSRFRGKVLDVGVGPQKCPTHIQFNEVKDVFFVGVDPLAGEQPRDFAFVQALGEYLPFNDKTFDQVLFVTSLDHFIDPVAALKEAARVMRDDGDMCVWLGEKDKNAPKPAVSPEWYKKLRIPEGAEDPFHFRRFTVEEFRGFLPESGLKIVEEEIHEVDQWRKNCFYRLKKA